MPVPYRARLPYHTDHGEPINGPVRQWPTTNFKTIHRNNDTYHGGHSVPPTTTLIVDNRCSLPTNSHPILRDRMSFIVSNNILVHLPLCACFGLQNDELLSSNCTCSPKHIAKKVSFIFFWSSNHVHIEKKAHHPSILYTSL